MIISIPETIKEGQEITADDLNQFATEVNNISDSSIPTGTNRLNGENIRNEGIDRRNITRHEVQRVGLEKGSTGAFNNGDGIYYRFGPHDDRSPPVWYKSEWKLPSPLHLQHPENFTTLPHNLRKDLYPLRVPGYTNSNWFIVNLQPMLEDIPVEKGDKVLVTCSFAFSVFPLDTYSNNLVNSATDPYGGYETRFRLRSRVKISGSPFASSGWTTAETMPGTFRMFNTVASSNVMSGGYRWVGTQNTCTIVGYQEIERYQEYFEVYLQSYCIRSNRYDPKDAVLRIKAYNIFVKIIK
jgi:hypothetical protein